MKIKKELDKRSVLILVILLFGTVGIFSYRYYRLKQTVETQVTTSRKTTTNWKTYQNENVTFNFPSEWVEKPILIRGSGFTQEFEDPGGNFYLAFLGNGNYNQVTGKPYASLEDYINFRYKEKVKKPITVDGQEGAEIFPRAGSENINSVEFFSEDSKVIYTLELQTGNTALDTSQVKIEEGRKLFDQILSTFKFTSLEMTGGEKPPIVDHFACGDYCPGPREKYMVKIYQGVEDEEECRKLGGRPSSYTGWGTTNICLVE